jgi:acetolactate synthase-1/2/3 large subunit
MRVADYIIQRLYDAGAKHIYLVTGRGILYLTDAVASHKDVTGICVHHEQAASYAATAYAKYNNKIGACIVSTGCASTNAITGLLCAWQDSVPCVFISGNNMLKETSRNAGIPLRTFGQQETDIVAVVDKLTKYAVMISDPMKIAYEIDKAMYLANEGRKGPVWIDVPLDVQDARIEPENLERYLPDASEKFDPINEDVKYVVNALQSAKRPVILLGSGVRSADALDELEAFLKKHPMPVTFSTSAPDTYGTKNVLSIGAVGSMGGTRAGNFAVQNSDLLLVLGSSLSPMTTSSEYKKFARASEIIVVDVDPIEHSKNTVKIDKLVLSDVKKFLVKLNICDFWNDISEWNEKCGHWKEVFPVCDAIHKASELVDLYYLTDCLSKALPEDAVICSDAGLEELIVPSNITLGSGQRCIHPNSQGAMGYALPSTIGAYHASKNIVAAVIGDGSIMMNIQELATIAYQKIPAKIFIINNNGYAIIRQRQRQFFRSRTIGNDAGDGVGIPDFRKVAECFDIPFIKISDSKCLLEKMKAVLDMDGPVLCEVLGLAEQSYLHSSYTRDQNKKVVHRPLEDQSPFLERETFLSEMIIDPIDQ